MNYPPMPDMCRRSLCVLYSVAIGLAAGVAAWALTEYPRETIAGVSAVIVAIVTTILVFHPDYEDGLFGRIFLAGMAFAAVARVTDIGMSVGVSISSIAVLMWASAAGFLLRHFWRFLRWRRTGEHSWRKADVASSGGKVCPHKAHR